MKLQHPFIQLPVRFDVDVLKAELDTIESSHWREHHEGFKGNYSIPLVSVGGTDNNAFKGKMAATSVLNSSPYLTQVITSFGEVIGRSRLMGLAPGEEVPLHSDINYHWYKRVRIHVPIVTDPEVIFYCGDDQVHMKAGEAWIFDSWKYHRVVNNSSLFRVHLVIDICGSSRFWALARKGNIPGAAIVTPESDFTLVAPSVEQTKPLLTEQFNTPLVMTPGEMDGLAGELFSELEMAKGNPAEAVDAFVQSVKDFCHDWRILWTRYGLTEDGWTHYHNLRQQAFESVRHFDTVLTLANGTQAPRMFLYCMIDPALNVDVKDSFASLKLQHEAAPAPAAPAPSTSSAESESAQSQQIPNDDGAIEAPFSRNAPCPCGSGKRYKSCHGKLSN